MKNDKNKSVLGVTAAAPRMTRAAAGLLAVALSVPVFAVLTVIQALF